ncbi:uncharacterized protein LOC108664985 isoform X2 [Hyalella azteca]|uniref:Uncharacterized protein LOC108664985 isoform X2 n=1 Tax=Hyalella azteca TaxID=294128 RepID=A0A979FQX3_HYAAZ|nr:uncharacterized protein LOC108664985 isoform X2 [Hyalella azteca]
MPVNALQLPSPLITTLKIFQTLDERLALRMLTKLFVTNPDEVSCQKSGEQSVDTTTASTTETSPKNIMPESSTEAAVSSAGKYGTLATEESFTGSTSSELEAVPYSHQHASRIRHRSQVRLVTVLTQGRGAPIIGAKVEAVISGPKNFTAVIALLDTGVAADTVAEDGAYSGFLTGVPGDGHYTISVRARSSPNSARILPAARPHRFWEPNTANGSPETSVGKFDVLVECPPGDAWSPEDVSLIIVDSGNASLTHIEKLKRVMSASDESATQYRGNITILKPSKLIAPTDCQIVATTQIQGRQSRTFLKTPASSALLLPQVDSPRSLFNVDATSSFPRTTSPLPTTDEENAGKTDLRIIIGTGDFKIEKPVERVEVVEYSARDLTPPGRVTDLRVTQVFYRSHSGDPAVSLQWTCPGDDLFSGTAAELELRYHRRQSTLRREFLRTTRVREGEHVQPGALTPLPANSVQNLTVILKDASLLEMTDDQMLYFGLRALDENRNYGHVSNLAVAHFSIAVMKQEFQASSNKLTLPLMSVMLVLFLVILLLVAYVKIKNHLNKRKQNNLQDISFDLNSEYYTKFGSQPRNKNGHAKFGPRLSSLRGSQTLNRTRDRANAKETTNY